MQQLGSRPWPCHGCQPRLARCHPCPLEPFAFPLSRELYHLAAELATDFGVLVHVASNNHDFILSSLESAAKADSFTGSLLKLYKQVHAEGGRKQKVELGLHRSDYMLHQPEDGPCSLLQVELNTISSAFGSLSSIVANMHRFVLGKIKSLQSVYQLTEDTLPQNKSGYALGDGIAKAWSLYGSKDAVVMIVVQAGDRNATDQRWIEYTLWDRHNVRMIRRTLKDIHERASLSSSNALLIDGLEVAVTYFRAGYTPKDYPTESEWDARLLIERSMTVACPSLAYHLVGAKKVQQVLSLPGVLERLLPNDHQRIERMRKCFAGLYSLDQGESEAAVQMALNAPSDYVLKPQREGGGNNFFGEELHRALSTMSPEERAGYILMQRIKPQPYKAYSYIKGAASLINVVSELGIYTVYVSNGEEEVMNVMGGHLLRTKAAGNEEGGVAAGYAVLDSPYLY